MGSNFNPLFRSGPGFSSGQISALGANGSKLDDPDFSLRNGGRGFDRVPTGYQEYLAKKAADAAQLKAANKEAKKAAKAARKGGTKDSLAPSTDDAHSSKSATAKKTFHAGPVARALHMLSPRKKNT